MEAEAWSWNLETEENEIAVFSGGAGVWREEGTETERILYTDVFGKYSTKICRMELMKLQYPQRLIRRTRLRKFWFRTVKSDM